MYGIVSVCTDRVNIMNLKYFIVFKEPWNVENYVTSVLWSTLYS